MLVINDRRFAERAEIIWEKGTNRLAFFRGEVQKYSWIDIGSSFLPSELNAAYLYAQLEELEAIQKRRQAHWDFYFRELYSLGSEVLPTVFPYSSNNAHIFYLTCRDYSQGSKLIDFLGCKGIQAVTHYRPLHLSEFYKGEKKQQLPNAERFSECIVRLPLFQKLSFQELQYIVKEVHNFFRHIDLACPTKENSFE
jgi:dTDP-4-amino-4,6-dideoxygalactose transaminase